MFGTGYGKLIVGVVGRIRMLFLDVSKGFLEGHQGRTEAVADETIELVSSTTAS